MHKYLFTFLIVATLTILVILSCTKIAQDYIWDITQNKTHTLTAESKALLDRLDTSLKISVYSPDITVLNTCNDLLKRYSKYSKHVTTELHQTIFHDYNNSKFNLFTDNNILITYKNVRHAMDVRLGELSEQQISTLIQKTTNAANQWVVFLNGHQEADPLDTSELGLSSFAQLLVKQGLHMTTLNLATQQVIPQNTALLIIANPQSEFLPIEEDLIRQYIAKGGKLLWLTEPDAKVTDLLKEEFGVKPSHGVAIDLASLQLGSPHPAVKIINTYPNHYITENLQAPVILPWSAHLQILFQSNNWQQEVFLSTDQNTWTYTGPDTVATNILSEYKEHTGPLNIGIALSRDDNTAIPQRALIISDSSFLLNKYLPLYANSQLATSAIEWSQQDVSIFIFNPAPLKDISYSANKLDRFLYQYFFIFMLPLLFISIGLYKSRRNTG